MLVESVMVLGLLSLSVVLLLQFWVVLLVVRVIYSGRVLMLLMILAGALGLLVN